MGRMKRNKTPLNKSSKKKKTEVEFDDSSDVSADEVNEYDNIDESDADADSDDNELLNGEDSGDEEEAVDGSDADADSDDNVLLNGEDSGDEEEALDGSDADADSDDNELLNGEDSSDEEEAVDGSSNDIVDGEDADDSENDDWLGDSKGHQKSLSNLAKTDPEFYTFLQENDKKLLQFNESDEDDDSDTDEQDKLHKPPESLEVDSEESDFEDERAERRGKGNVTLGMVKSLREELISHPTIPSISKAVDLFHAALDRVSGESTSQFKVDGSAVFNAVIEMCVLHLTSAIYSFLKVSPTTVKTPEKSKKWVKVRGIILSYFTDLFKLLNGVASEHILSVMLKHLHASCSLVACFMKLSKIALKQLVKLWSTGEETVRVLSFLCIIRLTIQKSSLLNSALKLLYIAYIRGSNFVSLNTLPQINFMKQTLVDLFSFDPALTYQHAFMYIRQLALHLRNAITTHKKENFQSVYNWQYIHSLRLWVDLLCAKHDSAELKPLVYPVVQIILGCIKLIPTAQYIPLRFHCIRMLIKLQRETNTFIPVLPLILESLHCTDMNKHHKKATMKPFEFTFILRLSKAALSESGFTDAILDNVFNLIIEYGATTSYNLSFPDLFIPAIVQLKAFLKTCRSSKYSSKLKLALSKINENFQMVSDERDKINLSLSEHDKIKALEMDIKARGTPLEKYWDILKKSQLSLKAQQAANNKKMAKELVLPKINNIKRKPIKEGPVDLLPSDESDIEFPEISDKGKKIERNGPPKMVPEQRKKLTKITKKTKVVSSHHEKDDTSDENEDIVEELDINNF